MLSQSVSLPVPQLGLERAAGNRNHSKHVPPPALPLLPCLPACFVDFLVILQKQLEKVKSNGPALSLSGQARLVNRKLKSIHQYGLQQAQQGRSSRVSGGGVVAVGHGQGASHHHEAATSFVDFVATLSSFSSASGTAQLLPLLLLPLLSPPLPTHCFV